MKLPLLDYTAALFREIRFENVLVIAVQHLLDTNFSMFEYLFRQGLQPKNTYLLGKCYSTNNEILRRFVKKGVNVDSSSTTFDSYKSFDKQFESEVKNFLKDITKRIDFRKYEKVILLDDGGYLIYFVNNLIKDTTNFTAIEQTSSGYNKLKNQKSKFPIINVARSEAKLRFESPFIAEEIVKQIYIKLKRFKLSPKKVLIVGAGPIGKEIYKLLSKDFKTNLFDNQYKDSDFRNVELKNIISGFDLIIGATGNEIISSNDLHRLMNKTMLVSASSSDREFSATTLRKKTLRNTDCHKDILINGIYLINSGFPINFDGKKNSVSPERIQLTRAIMLAAVFLAMRNKYEPGIINLDLNLQQKLIREFEKLKLVSN
jgi:S-adenosylhomocysteine hydrolase